MPLADAPQRPPLPAILTDVRWAQHPGVLQQVDLPRLVRDVEAADSLVVLRVAVGDVVDDGTVVATVHGSSLRSSAVLACLSVGTERTFDQDPLLAIRVLVDIGLKALSPAVNDPTTAVQVIDSTESLLRRLGARELDVGHVIDDDGTLRVIVPLPTWEAYLELGNDELALAAVASPTVLRRLERCLVRLGDDVPPLRRPAVEERLRWVRRALDGRSPVLAAEPAQLDPGSDGSSSR